MNAVFARSEKSLFQHDVRANPLPHEAHVIARVQSLRTRNGRVAEPLDYEKSLRILARLNRPTHVTVPADSAVPPAADTGACAESLQATISRRVA